MNDLFQIWINKERIINNLTSEFNSMKTNIQSFLKQYQLEYSQIEDFLDVVSHTILVFNNKPTDAMSKLCDSLNQGLGSLQYTFTNVFNNYIIGKKIFFENQNKAINRKKSQNY